MNSQIQLLIQQFRINISKIQKPLEKICHSTAFVQQQQYSFSNTLKPASITIADKTATQTANQNQENRLVLVDPCLAGEARIAFRIVSATSSVGVGVALKSVLTAKK